MYVKTLGITRVLEATAAAVQATPKSILQTRIALVSMDYHCRKTGCVGRCGNDVFHNREEAKT